MSDSSAPAEAETVVHISVPSTKLRTFPDGREHMTYEVVSTLATGQTWTVWRRFAEFDHFRALRAPGGGCPSFRAASGPRNQLLGAARHRRAAQQHSALGPIWAFLGLTSPRGVVAGTFLDTELIGSIAVADRAGLGRRRRNRSRQTRRDGPIADLLH